MESTEPTPAGEATHLNHIAKGEKHVRVRGAKEGRRERGWEGRGLGDLEGRYSGSGSGGDPLGRGRRNPTGQGCMLKLQSSKGSNQHFPFALAPLFSQRNGSLSIVVAGVRNIGSDGYGTGG